MRTKIGILSILMTVLLALGGTAAAQETGTETQPEETMSAEASASAEVGTEGVDAEAEMEADAETEEMETTASGDEELPQTASILPALGALGLLSLAGGAALRARKR